MKQKKKTGRKTFFFAAAILVSVQAAFGGVDLRGYGVTMPFDVQESAVNWGDSVTIRLDVANYGTSDAGGFYIGLYLSSNTTIGDGDDYLFCRVGCTNGLLSYRVASMGYTSITLPSVNPLSGAPSTIYIGMVVDVDGQVAEDNESNNRNLGTGIDRDDTPVTITAPVPNLLVTDSIAPFNDLAVVFSNAAVDGVGNVKETQTITLLNQGKASLTISNLVLTGSTNFALTQIASSLQSFIQQASLPRVLASKGSESWVLTVEFDPTSTNTETASLMVRSNDPDTPGMTVSLSGTGVPVADIALTTDEAAETDFGTVLLDGVGGCISERAISIKNTGTGPLIISQNGLSLLEGTHFSMLAVTSSIRGAVSLASGPEILAAGGLETWDIILCFDPQGTGQQNDGLQIQSDDPDESLFIVSLRGYGAKPMALAVTDSEGSADDHVILFAPVHADGPGKRNAEGRVILQNTGEAPLTVEGDGITLADGSHFAVQRIDSDTQGEICLTNGAVQLAGSTSETWTVTVVFDPSVSGALSDTLTIRCDDPLSPVTQVALSGEGVARPALLLTDESGRSLEEGVVDFGPVLNDGVGERVQPKTFILMNEGASPLIIAQSGLVLNGSTAFSLTGVLSSIDGPVDIGSDSEEARTLAPAQAEIWMLSMVYDPLVNHAETATLSIISNDPIHPDVETSMTGTGVVPWITVLSPDTDLNVSAGSVFPIRWSDQYAAGDAGIALWLDDNTNETDGGLLLLSDGLSSDEESDLHAWRVDEALAGTTYYVYATIADGSVTNGSYSSGRLTIDAPGAFKLRSPVQVTSADYAYEYEYNGQVYQGITHLGAGDNVITVSNPLPDGGMASFQFTVRLVPSLIHAETITHDELNRVEETRNGNGMVTRLIYDQMSRLVRRESDNGAVVEYGYDVLGRRTNMVDATGTTFYEWDDLDRITAILTSVNGIAGDDDDMVLRYEYDPAGLKTAVVYPSGARTEYQYDDAGRMLSASNVMCGLFFTWQYNAGNGLLMARRLPNGIETLYDYDGMGRTTNIHHRKSDGGPIVDFGYTLDAAGKVTVLRKEENGILTGVEWYTYDRFDRLIEVIYSEDDLCDDEDRSVTYTYDGSGNRLGMTMRSGGETAEGRLYEYGNENRLLRIADHTGEIIATYGYDAAGNMIQETTADRTRFFSYDERNLLISMIDGSNKINYAYNGEGQRVKKTVNGVETIYVNDVNQPLWETVEEYRADGVMTVSRIYGNECLAVCEAGGIAYGLADRLGSVRQVADETGEVTTSVDYDVFGATRINSGTLPDRFFTGAEEDPESGLLFLRARYYNPLIGRFIVKDPLGITAGVNAYAYVGNDPVNYTDSQGLLEQGEVDTSYEAFINGYYGKKVFDTVVYYGINSTYEDAYAAAVKIGLDMSKTTVKALFGKADSLGELAEQCLTVAGRQIGLLGGTEGGTEFQDAYIKNVILFSGGDATFRADAAAYNITYGNMKAYASTIGVDGKTELCGELNHGAIEVDLLVGGVLPRVVTTSDGDSMMGVGYTVKGNTILGAIGNFISGVVSAVGSLFGMGTAEASENVGGVLIDKAAEWVGSNLSDIRGAVYDPISGQFVLLGSDGDAGVEDIDLDCLYAALQAVYGSAVPPFVTLDPPASAYTQWQDYGDGDGIFEPGEKGGFLLRYNPIWSQVDTNVDVTINAEWSGTHYRWTARFDCIPQNIINNWGKAMKLVFKSWTSSLPSGVTFNTTPWQNSVWSESCLTLNADGQEFLGRFTLNNGSAQNFIITGVSVIPSKQHRKFGGRAENTKLGWIMLEADRVMKCLSIGKDNLTGAMYNSGTISVPGYSNMTQRGGTGNIRMWFTPNEMTLMRHLDAASGRASIVFDEASVALNTESFMMGMPQPAEARAFADHFTAHYDAFAELEFPCVDPEDPTGTNIVYAKIFKQLREAMQAVSLARFFRDNNIPVDMWWLNSWTPPVAYSVKATPTAYNEENGMIIYGGVQVNKPNTYVPSATAKSVADVVQTSRSSPTRGTTDTDDIQAQVWTNETTLGALTAVAAQTDAEPLNGNIRLSETDMSFACPGAMPLKFARYYNSSWMGGMNMGAGWRVTPFALEFERPSWFDENSLMRHGTNTVWKDSRKDTRLRSGAVRVVDLESECALDFTSSLILGYSVDNVGNAIITVSGLSSNGVPTFEPGIRQNGATLIQLTNNYSYRFTMADGIQVVFDYEGRVLETSDRYGKRQTYSRNTAGTLTNITDMAGQSISLVYDAATTQVECVTGPGDEQVNYAYSNGCLISATHLRSGAVTVYAYNENRQMIEKTVCSGLKTVQATTDLKGRAGDVRDVRNNTLINTYTQTDDGSVRITEMSDPSISDPSLQPWRQYFDREGRLLTSQDSTGAETSYGYDTGSLLPNTVQLPITGRPVISIERDSCGRPVQISDPGNIGAQDVTAIYDETTGQLLRHSDAAGRSTEILYNSNQSVAGVRRVLNGEPVISSYGYNTNGALCTVTNELGIPVITYQRDTMDRVTNIVDATGISTVYEYDSLGRLYKVYDPRLSGPMEYVYDGADHIIQINYPTGSVYFEYDTSTGWLVRETDILGRATRYVRDPDTGDILQIILEDEGEDVRVTELSYNRFGQITNITPSDAQSISYQYDDLGRLLGSSEMDNLPPGAPKALDSDRADSGTPTFVTNHLFTWGAPDTDSGIAGYSLGYDQTPEELVGVTNACAPWYGVEAGIHTVSVCAVANNGLWGPPATFILVVRSMSEYDQWRVTHFDPTEADNDTLSGPEIDYDGDGMLNESEYLADTNPKNPLSLLKITGVYAEGSGARVYWKGGEAATQTLEYRAKLNGGSWIGNFTNHPPTATETNIFDELDSDNIRYYRIKASR